MSERPSQPAIENDLLDEASMTQLSELLRSAYAPAPISDARNRMLIELALEDPLAEASAEELVESDRLRRALEGDGDHPNATLARALRAAIKSPESAPAKRSLPPPRKVYVLFGAAAAITALAASVLLVLRPVESRREPSAIASSSPATPLALAEARSTQELFTHKFEAAETSARVDRIALVRARELRANRYTMWGVR
jgi:hypothetical protein